jgi:hypothetical protein
MGVQKHYKKRFAKQNVSKSSYKKIDQKSKTDFFLDFFGEGGLKTPQPPFKKISVNKSDPGPWSFFGP